MSFLRVTMYKSSGLTAVSYTHLDVYKRQEYKFENFQNEENADE